MTVQPEGAATLVCCSVTVSGPFSCRCGYCFDVCQRALAGAACFAGRQAGMEGNVSDAGDVSFVP
ncbi:MAG: hypothetical protein F4Z17_09540 [Acidimicrobiia bacterium]|nr:hypothetical protein [Acidimicrobiia bacterium]MYB44247.1 hypothetical protein [Acidimicrobiia bacterium]